MCSIARSIASDRSRTLHFDSVEGGPMWQFDNSVVPRIATEVPGTKARALLEQEGQLSVPRALDIAGQVANALDAGHAIGLVHRDVKPDNVLLDAPHTGYPDRALLCDFGIYDNRATGVQELDEQSRTVRFQLSFVVSSVRLAQDRWTRLLLYAKPYAELLDIVQKKARAKDTGN